MNSHGRTMPSVKKYAVQFRNIMNSHQSGKINKESRDHTQKVRFWIHFRIYYLPRRRLRRCYVDYWSSVFALGGTSGIDCTPCTRDKNNDFRSAVDYCINVLLCAIRRNFSSTRKMSRGLVFLQYFPELGAIYWKKVITSNCDVRMVKSFLGVDPAHSYWENTKIHSSIPNIS